MSMLGKNLMEPEPTLLPPEPEVTESLAAYEEPVDLAAKHPTSSLVWALLAEDALDGGYTVEGYAYARVGYHRGLDSLRQNGWKGTGPVPTATSPTTASSGPSTPSVRPRPRSERSRRSCGSTTCWTTATPPRRRRSQPSADDGGAALRGSGDQVVDLNHLVPARAHTDR